MKTHTGTGVIRLILAVALIALPMLSRASMSDLPEGWLTDWDQAIAKAKAENKPILAVFSAEWCGPCQMMVKDVYPQAAVRKMLEAWVPVYLDDEKAAATHEKFAIEGYPTFVILSSEGAEEDRFVGGLPEKMFIERVGTGHVLAKRIAEIKAELAKTPENVALHKEYGDIQIKLDETETAIESYRTAAKLDPEDKVGVADDLFIFDNLPQAQEQVEAALAKFESFEKTFPKSDRLDLAAYFHARILAFMERYAEAVKVLEAAMARFPESEFADSMSMMANALKQQLAPPATEAGAPETVPQ